jgi:hypothetical protein
MMPEYLPGCGILSRLTTVLNPAISSDYRTHSRSSSDIPRNRHIASRQMKVTYLTTVTEMPSPRDPSDYLTVVRSILNVASPQRASGIFAVQGQ